MRELGKYMAALPPTLSATGKTQIWSIRSARGVDILGCLGEVRWFGRWRCYAFFPEHDTVFNAACMTELVEFCDKETKEHRRK